MTVKKDVAVSPEMAVVIRLAKLGTVLARKDFQRLINGKVSFIYNPVSSKEAIEKLQKNAAMYMGQCYPVGMDNPRIMSNADLLVRIEKMREAICKVCESFPDLKKKDASIKIEEGNNILDVAASLMHKLSLHPLINDYRSGLENDIYNLGSLIHALVTLTKPTAGSDGYRKILTDVMDSAKPGYFSSGYPSDLLVLDRVNSEQDKTFAGSYINPERCSTISAISENASFLSGKTFDKSSFVFRKCA